MVDEKGLAKENLAKRIAGEIVLSPDAGKTIQKWRDIFKIPQRALAEMMGVMPSVISDYENSRRKSPGIKAVKRIVDAMIALDEKIGGKVIKEFSNLAGKEVLSEVILDLREFHSGVSVRDFCKAVGATLVVGMENEGRLHGYTVVDAQKAIVELSPMEMVKLYGLTNERALVFTGARSGRSSMVALKVANLKPSVVILHGGLENPDDLAKRIALSESIPLAVVKGNLDDFLTVLKKEFGGR